MEVRYTPGTGLLLARGRRWLLLAGPDPSARVLDELWRDLGHPDGIDRALATVRGHLPDVPLAWLDATTGAHEATGGADVAHDGDRWELGLGRPATGTVLRLAEGVVHADAVSVAGLVTAPGATTAAPPGMLIDGIPPEILGSSAEPRTVRRTATPPRPPESPDTGSTGSTGDTDHDRQTRMRTRDPRVAEAAPTAGHLEQPTSDTVLAVRCDRGHLTDPLLGLCRVCGSPVPPQEPSRVLRPPLGLLRLPDGESVQLDRPVVLGRRPAPSGPGDWPHLVRLPQDSTYLSRLHVRIDLDGWHVLAQDLGSRGGTTLFAPGRDPEKIRGHEPHLLESGTTLDLAGAYQVTYLSTAPAEEPT